MTFKNKNGISLYKAIHCTQRAINRPTTNPDLENRNTTSKCGLLMNTKYEVFK